MDPLGGIRSAVAPLATAEAEFAAPLRECMEFFSSVGRPLSLSFMQQV